MAPGERIVLFRSWRSECWLLIVFFVTSVLSPVLSSKLTWTVIHGPLFSWGATRVFLALPLFWLIPATVLSLALYRVYNVKYVIDDKGVECWSGILALKQRITRVRFDDIRGVETDQSILGRVLNFGDVELGTAGTGQIEAILRGIVSPKTIQELIQDARDRHQSERSRGDGGNDDEARAT
jgi:uncharacterized membrane protein YdbT with pleckstrin-like domain